MNAQEVFNKSYLGLKSQGFRQSVNEEGKCVYRSKGKHRCAIGHCIPDNLYKKDIEGMCATLAVSILEDQTLFSDVNGCFLNDLQNIHDKYKDPEVMQLKLKEFAEERDLTVPE
jgi:hypothetical protein